MKPNPIPKDEDREDFKALRERNVLLTDSLRNLLWIALDWHDVTRDKWAAEIIRSAPKGREVKSLTAALKAWRDDRESDAARAEANARYDALRERAAALGIPPKEPVPVPCRRCRATILWWPQPSGKFVPVDADGTPHRETCGLDQ